MTTANLQDAPLAASDKQEAMEQSGPKTFDEIVAQRTKEMAERSRPPEPEAPVEEVEETDEPEEVEETEGESGDIPEESEAQEDEDDVLSQFNLESLSEEELAALGERIRSKVPKRFGELTKARKEAEEKVARLEAELAKRQEEKDPLEPDDVVENNPFSDLKTVQELQKQNKEFMRIIEWADELLDDNDDASNDDIITEQDGKSLTKKQVKEYQKQARKAREKFLPARLTEIQREQQEEQVRAALEQKATKEFDWYGDTDSDVRREYELVVNDPRINAIREKVPEVRGQLDYLLAHAVHSMSQMMKKEKKPAAKKTTTLRPPSNPSEGAARGTDRDDSRLGKELKELQQRFKQTHSAEDFAILRTKQRLRKT